MEVIEGRLEKLFSKKVEDLYHKKATEVANGVPTENYRENVGYLRGLKDALRLISEARAELWER